VQKLTTATLWQVVQRVLTTPSYRERSAKFAEELRGMNGQARAADLIEKAFISRQRGVHAGTISKA
jgi:UDP:flavonoid glycosyltransferase YjiC (YdhE family)